MGDIVTILATLARVLAIITIVSVTVAAQSGHDHRPIGMVAFALWAAFGAWISSSGNWLATAFIIIFSALASVKIFDNRADNFMTVIIGAATLHIIAPIFKGRSFVWNGWNTLVIIIFMVIELAVVIFFDRKQRTDDVTTTASKQKVPWLVVAAVAAFSLLVCGVTMSILVA